MCIIRKQRSSYQSNANLLMEKTGATTLPELVDRVCSFSIFEFKRKIYELSIEISKKHNEYNELKAAPLPPINEGEIKDLEDKYNATKQELHECEICNEKISSANSKINECYFFLFSLFKSIKENRNDYCHPLFESIINQLDNIPISTDSISKILLVIVQVTKICKWLSTHSIKYCSTKSEYHDEADIYNTVLNFKKNKILKEESDQFKIVNAVIRNSQNTKNLNWRRAI